MTRPGRDHGERWVYGRHAVAAALDNPDRRVLKAWATREATGIMQFPRNVTVTLADVADLGRLVPNDAPHQGVVIEVEALGDIWLDGILADAPERAVVLVLDQVTDPHNVGAVLRSAAAFGAAAVIVTEHAAPPSTGVLGKAASGALEIVPLVRVVNLARALDRLKEAGFWCCGLDAEAPEPLAALDLGQRAALVLGSEGGGLRRLVRERCDYLARLPTGPALASLNVSNAAAIALYELVRGDAG